MIKSSLPLLSFCFIAVVGSHMTVLIGSTCYTNISNVPSDIIYLTYISNDK